MNDLTDEEKPESNILIGDHTTIIGDVFTGGKHIYQIHRPPIGTPFQAPPLPSHFVPRPEVTDALKARLLADSPTTPGILVVSAIHGLGGTGKSTLAAALAYDKEVQQRFNDGILWATLGQQPELLSLLSTWVQALGDYDFRPTTVEAATIHLRTLLQDKAALLVVDDVWNPDHAKPFRVGGPQCHMLITTREAIVTEVVNAERYLLGEMTLKQALSLISKKLGRELEGAEQDSATALAETVGCLPLALKLAAAQVADGISWSQLLVDLQAEIARLETLEFPEVAEITDEAMLKDLSIRASFNLSLRRLPQGKFERFAWLGILPEGVTLTPAMATTLWDTNIHQAGEALRYLHRKALLEWGIPQPDGSLTYHLHDLLHDMARRLLTTPPEPAQANNLPGLGLTLPAAQATLLTRYQKQTRDGLWHTLPNDGYIHSHLTWHMERTGQVAQIHTLLQEETTEQHNGWYHVQDQLDQMAGYLTDITRAWYLAEEAYANHHLPLTIGYQCRYALITASLNSLTKNIPPALLVALVEKGILTQTRGLAYARQIPDSWLKTKTLSDLALLLARLNYPQQALVATQAIKNEYQSSVLIKLAQYLPEAMLAEAVVTAQRIEKEFYRALTLARLSPHLSEPLLREVLNSIRLINNPEPRALALAELIPYLPIELKSEAMREGVAAAIEIENTLYDRSKALKRLAPHLQGRFMDEAMEAVKAITWEAIRAKTLTEFVPYLSEPAKSEALRMIVEAVRQEQWTHNLEGLTPRLAELGYVQEALEAWKVIKYPDTQVKELPQLIPYLSESLLEVALRELLIIDQTFWHTNTTGLLATPLSCLPVSLLDEVLEVVHSVERVFPWVKSHALAMIINRLAELGQYQKALTETRAIENYEERITIFVNIVPHLPSPISDEVLQEALTLVQKFVQKENQVLRLATIIPHMPDLLKKKMLRETLNTVRMIEKERSQKQSMAALLPLLIELDDFEEALVLIKTLKEEYLSEEKLAGMAVKLAQSQRYQEAIIIIWMIEDEGQRARTIIEIANYVSPQLMEQLLEVALAIRWDDYRAKALAGLARYLPVTLLDKALEAVAEIKKDKARADALVGLDSSEANTEKWWAEHIQGLVPYLPEALLEKALTIALTVTKEEYQELTIALKATKEEARTRSIDGLVPYLSEGLLRKSLAALWEIADEEMQALTLTNLIPYLPETSLQEALTTVRMIKDKQLGVKALVMVAQRFPEPLNGMLLREALILTETIKIADQWVETFTWLVPHITKLPSSLSNDLLKEAFDRVKIIIEPKKAQIEALIALSPHLPEPLLKEAFAIIERIEDQQDRVWGLVNLAPYLAKSLPREILEVVRAIEWNGERLRALAALAPYLPEPLKDEVLRESLTVAWKSYSTDDRILVLEKLVPHLSASLLGEVLEIARSMRSVPTQFVKALAILIPRLPPTEQDRALREAVTTLLPLLPLEDHIMSFKIEALAELAPHLPKPLLREALAAIEKVKDKYDWFKLFTTLVPHLVKFGCSEEMLALVGANARLPSFEENVLMELWPKLAELGHYEEALMIVQMIYDEKRRTKALTKIVSDLPADLLPKIIEEKQKIKDKKLQAKIMMQLMPRYTEQPSATLYSFWRETLHILAQYPRQDILLDFYHLAPVMATLGGSEAIEEAFHAIQDVGRWWP